jgi:hypothetical protein
MEADGHRFPSKAEHDRYWDLKFLQDHHAIRDLELQPRFPLIVNDIKIGEYRGDFRYYDLARQEVVVEDVKGFKTKEYKLKKKLVLALYGIEILET